MAPSSSSPADMLPQGGRVLVVRMSALGDVLFALETVAALHRARPDVTIDFLVDKRFAGLLEGHPEIDRVHAFPRNRRRSVPGFLLGLRRHRYDVLLDLHGLLKSALCVFFARARTKLGFAPPAAREGSHRLYHRAVPLATPLPHRADRGYALLREMGIDAPQTRPSLGIPEHAPLDIRNGASPVIALHPGTSAFAAFKRWPTERFGTLARALLDRGSRVLVSYGPGERELADTLLQLAPGLERLDGAETGLLGLAAVYRDADVVVAADTGPLHMAAAVGTPVVALFGPKDHNLYGPRGPGHTVLYRDVPCRPCKRRRCPAPMCVRGLEVERVLEAVVVAAEPSLTESND